VGVAEATGELPATKAFWAWLMRTARVEPSRDTSTRWPPASARPMRPARTPIAP
jgi:hypothetical protein